VNWREAAHCGEWAQHFSNASCNVKATALKQQKSNFESAIVSVQCRFYVDIVVYLLFLQDK